MKLELLSVRDFQYFIQPPRRRVIEAFGPIDVNARIETFEAGVYEASWGFFAIASKHPIIGAGKTPEAAIEDFNRRLREFYEAQ